MSAFDLIIRGGTVVRLDGAEVMDLGIADGRIAALGAEVSGAAREVMDATGLMVLPGLIDSHVHFNEPGRAEWEGIASGSRALAAGGGTLFFDMPLNAHPPTCDGESFDQKLAAARGRALTDFAFWGGLVPQNADRLEVLARRGVIGFKAFMSDSGIADFSRADENTLRTGMRQAAALNLPVAVHAESETLTRRLAAERLAAGKWTVRDYLESRPVAAELEAIRCATDLAGETGCKLHVVHVSSGAGVALITAARQAGVDVSCETCPHYLVLTETDAETLGAAAKCAPPLRAAAVQDDLWARLLAGEVHTIGSDHSPAPPEMKQAKNFFQVWGGISGVQHTLPLLWQGRGENGLSPGQIARLTAFIVAERFRLPAAKGRIELGADADLALVDPRQTQVVRADELFYRHRQSPYLGRTLTIRVVRTTLRGRTIFSDGRIAGPNQGELVKPL